MAFDFPATPTEGQVYNPAGGPTYVYQAPSWRVLPPGSTATAETRNRIVNGAMQWSQEYGNTPIGPGFPADQWNNAYSLTTGVMQAQRVQTVTPKGSIDRLQLKATTAAAAPSAAQYSLLQQGIEGQRVADLQWGTANAKKAVLRFGFKGPAGTYYAALRNSVSGTINASIVFPIVISAGQANTDTEQIFSVPGPTIGTFAKDTACGLGLTFTFACGTTLSAPAANVWQASNYVAGPGISNGAGVLNNTFEIFDVGLYADPNGTGVPPIWEAPDPASELALCQRYYQEIYGIAWSNSVITSQGMYCNTGFAVPPRPGAVASGVNSINSSMAATVGTLAIILNSLRELRSFTATANAGGFATSYTINARM